MGQRGEWRSFLPKPTAHYFSCSELYAFCLPVLEMDGGQKTGEQFVPLSRSPRLGSWQLLFPSLVLLPIFQDSRKVNSTSFFTYIIAFTEEGNWFNPWTLEIF